MSEKDIELILALCSSLSVKEIAASQNRKFASVQNQIYQIALKLKTSGRHGIILKALKKRIIKLTQI